MRIPAKHTESGKDRANDKKGNTSQEDTVKESFDGTLEKADANVIWVLDHPEMSPWIKDALRAALVADPITVANEVEVLRQVIVPRSNALVRKALDTNEDH